MISNMLRLIWCVVFVFIVKFGQCKKCPSDVQVWCYEQTSCLDCLRIHSCCHWCYDETFTNTKCNFLEELESCKTIERNKETARNVTKDEEFTTITSSRNVNKAIQIKPQSFKVVLREGTPVNLSFTYKAAKNYPLELYYLADLSYSMQSDIETLKNLGDQLGKNLESLTTNYRLAFGSFLDKPAMPFIETDPIHLDNPCRWSNTDCKPTYLFKHKLNFTKDTDKFFEKVRSSEISANNDDLDGALEAIFQILVCNKKLGWTSSSRKIIVLSTKSQLHTAGDGILVGASLRNAGRCLIDARGEHTDPLKYDYPSMAEIKQLLKKYQVNLIIAVPKDRIDYYKRMKIDILNQEAFIGELKENSSNILDLVSTGFHNYIRQVNFFTNTSHAPELDVKFYGDCEHFNEFNETSECQNVEEEVPTEFKIQITLKETVKGKSTEQLFIKEKNIDEEIQIDFEYAINCDCEKNQKPEIQCENGFVSCGECVCDRGWTGINCSTICPYNPSSCRPGDKMLTCSGRADCVCGKCQCKPPYIGKYCEFECPVNKHGKVCNDRGICFNGTCQCNDGYGGKDCTCELSTDKCKFGSDIICYSAGMCECNTCKCNAGSSGKYCEIDETKNRFCEIFDRHVISHLVSQTTIEYTTDKIPIHFTKRMDTEEPCDTGCSLKNDVDNENCLIVYCYNQGNNNTIYLTIIKKLCSKTASASFIGIGVLVATLLFGFLGIAAWKYRIHKLDQMEYSKFQKNLNEAKMEESNPIYKSPVSTFVNPMANTRTSVKKSPMD